jgi:hypothetical protein
MYVKQIMSDMVDVPLRSNTRNSGAVDRREAFDCSASRTESSYNYHIFFFTCLVQAKASITTKLAQPAALQGG